MKELKRALIHLAPNFDMRRRRTALLLLSLLAAMLPAAGCFESKVITSKVNPPSNPGQSGKMNGVFYALPRTVIKADVPVVKTVKKKGEFVQFTPCFFPDEEFIAANETKFGIKADDVKFDTTFVPDSGEVYMIKTTGGMFETRNLELALTESGVFVKGSADVTNETIDLVTGSIKTGVGLLAKASSFGFLSPGNPDTSAQTRLTEAQQQCQTVLNVPIDPANFKKAFDLYTRIVELQTKRSSILELTLAPATIPADTLKLTLTELDAAIKQLKDSGFFGTEEKLTWNASFRVNPQDPPAGSPYYTRPLMKLSETKGVCAILVNQGVRVDGRFKAKECREGVREIRMKVALGEDGEGGPNAGGLMADKIRAAQLKQTGDRGFYYRVPGRAIAILVQDGETEAAAEVELGRAPLSIAQYGQVVSLPASTGGRKTKYTLELFESSGGLKNFVMGSSALIQQKNVTDLTDAIGTGIEAKGERNKAKAPADELQQLERQRKILEEKKKIRDLEGELNAESDSEENNN